MVRAARCSAVILVTRYGSPSISPDVCTAKMCGCSKLAWIDASRRKRSLKCASALSWRARTLIATSRLSVRSVAA